MLAMTLSLFGFAPSGRRPQGWCVTAGKRGAVAVAATPEGRRLRQPAAPEKCNDRIREPARPSALASCRRRSPTGPAELSFLIFGSLLAAWGGRDRAATPAGARALIEPGQGLRSACGPAAAPGARRQARLRRHGEDDQELARRPRTTWWAQPPRNAMRERPEPHLEPPAR